MEKLKPQCKDVAEVYDNVARVLRMCESAGVGTSKAWKFDGKSQDFCGIDLGVRSATSKEFMWNISVLEFAVGTVDGIPVFRGEAAFTSLDYERVTIVSCAHGGIICSKNGKELFFKPSELTILPPKPKTCTITLNCDISKIALLGAVGGGHLLSFPVDAIKDPMQWLKQQVDNNKGAAC